MAAPTVHCLRRRLLVQSAQSTICPGRTRAPAVRRTPLQTWHTRAFQTKPQVSRSDIPDFAFAFDIDGVLVRSSTPLPGAQEALAYLQSERIPFILLTNGGGISEQERVAYLSDKLDIPLDVDMFVQSHTPFAELSQYKDKTVLVVGGDYDNCQRVAKDHYGFANVVTPGDIVAAYPDIWPFSKVFLDYYRSFAKPLPAPIDPSNPSSSLKIDAIFVYNDPRDWGLDSSIILDTLLASNGILGTLSSKNNTPSLPNNGYLQESPPPLYYANPDLWFASSYHLSRLGQGGFRAAFEGLWHTATRDSATARSATLDSITTQIGKPHQPTYEFAENRLRQHRKHVSRGITGLNDPLRRVYMVGDNPESDIRGANSYRSPHGSRWESILVKTGVYQDGTAPTAPPTVIVDGVLDAVKWGVQDARSKSRPQ
nr:putative cdp-alcohol phosphatidyltransferase class-i family protein c22a12.08c [Quercus suber]